ncbi:MAG TPA: alpha/beta fold hydrolase, partial [Vicinamibacterales bacterium]|nr:alpha/beta fold hydrolase [Vicinamibacterales bacterium]
RDGPAAVGADMRAKLIGSSSRAHRPDVVAGVERMMEGLTATGVGYAVTRMMFRPDSSADLAAFRGPVTVVVGEEDVLTPPADGAALAALAPGAALETIPGAGHLPNLEAPESFNGAMLAWLQAIERSSA